MLGSHLPTLTCLLSRSILGTYNVLFFAKNLYLFFFLYYILFCELFPSNAGTSYEIDPVIPPTPVLDDFASFKDSIPMAHLISLISHIL